MPAFGKTNQKNWQPVVVSIFLLPSILHKAHRDDLMPAVLNKGESHATSCALRYPGIVEGYACRLTLLRQLAQLHCDTPCGKHTGDQRWRVLWRNSNRCKYSRRTCVGLDGLSSPGADAKSRRPHRSFHRGRPNSGRRFRKPDRPGWILRMACWTQPSRKNYEGHFYNRNTWVLGTVMGSWSRSSCHSLPDICKPGRSRGRSSHRRCLPARQPLEQCRRHHAPDANHQQPECRARSCGRQRDHASRAVYRNTGAAAANPTGKW